MPRKARRFIIVAPLHLTFWHCRNRLKQDTYHIPYTVNESISAPLFIRPCRRQGGTSNEGFGHWGEGGRGKGFGQSGHHVEQTKCYVLTNRSDYHCRPKSLPIRAPTYPPLYIQPVGPRRCIYGNTRCSGVLSPVFPAQINTCEGYIRTMLPVLLA